MDLEKSLESTSEPAFAVDESGKIVAWSRALETALGHRSEWAVGRTCHEVLCGRDALGNAVCRPNCFVRRTMRAGRPVPSWRMHIRSGSGHFVEAECVALAVVSSEGEPSIVHLLRPWPGGAPLVTLGDGDDRRLPGAAGPGLTPRELEVLRLLAAGRSTTEMAEALGVSAATVRTHVEHVLGKLQAHSRLEAVLIAARTGLLGPAGPA